MSSDSDSSGLPPMPGLRRTAARGIAVAGAGVGAAQQVGEPSIASRLGIGRADRRRFGAARIRRAEVRRRQTRCAAGVARTRRGRGCGEAAAAALGAPSAGCQHLLLVALRARAGCGHHVQSAAVTCDDPVQFGQRLDLVDNDLAHLRGALGGFLRHLQHAAAKFAARGFQLCYASPAAICFMPCTIAANLSADCLNMASASCVLLLVHFAHGVGCQPAFLLRRRANRFKLPADRGESPRRPVSATTRAISRARASAADSDSSSRPVNRDNR